MIKKLIGIIVAAAVIVIVVIVAIRRDEFRSMVFRNEIPTQAASPTTTPEPRAAVTDTAVAAADSVSVAPTDPI